MTSTENNMESTTLLNKKTNEESTSFKKYLTPKYAIAATATIALGALGVASQSTSFSRGQLKLGSSNATSNNKVVVRQSRLGAGSPQTISLHTGCSPLNKLPFDTSSDWTGKIGAKVVSKSMQSDFRFENAQNLQETSCGNYEGTVDLEVGEEFGFYLYPLGDESDESTVLDNGCLHEGDGRCPAFSSPSALAGIEQCTSKYSDPGSGDVFYNRVFDGETLAYNWGTCETTCAVAHPEGCAAVTPVTEPNFNPSNVVCSMTIDNSIESVKYDGQELTTDSGNVDNWGSVKKYSFTDAGTSAKLEIYGYEWANCNGCGCAGLGVHCVSDDSNSPWHNFVSDTTHWQSRVETPSALVGQTVNNFGYVRKVTNVGDTEYATPCLSGSGFGLSGYQANSACDAEGTDGKYCKIWAAGDPISDSDGTWSNMYVRFNGSPYTSEEHNE